MPSERIQRQIDRLLTEAEAALPDGQWDVVKKRADAVLRLDPENGDAVAYMEAAVRPSSLGARAASPSGTASKPDPSQRHETHPIPSAFASGRYTVRKFLGEGGKKKVYLAHDNTLDRDVAFALIKTESLDEVSRERVRREAQAMGRMGTHPAIMPIYDLGDEAGQPYMVQPLMAGGDVESLIEKAGGALDLDRAIEIAEQVCRGLSFAHGKGIVHRDLKPGNVWLDENGAIKIGDFGLAVATDRSRLTVEKVMVGTVNYMPPEQATGGELTPRADLYSLGAMLYEMCTGRVPFMGDDDIAVIGQHVNTPPVAPSWHNRKIPKTLDSLILRLLAKDPAERPATGDEVLQALGAVDLSAVEERGEEKKGSLDSMAGGVFVGRQREMDKLKSIFEEVLSGRGRMVTLVGEPGIGKTRTAQELATYAGMRGAEVVWGRSYESGGAPPYWPWVQAIRTHVSATDHQSLRTQLGSGGPVVAEIAADIREKLPDLPEPVKIDDPESARFRLFDSISTFLKNASRTQPVVLMLEDLHWADRPSLMLLEFVARELANSRLMIVGNYRDVELNRRHALSLTLGELTRERLFERVLLRGLQKHDVARFIEIAAGITPPPALVDTVYTQTEGNPLFVTETVRLLIQEGDITAGRQAKAGTTTWEIRIPEGVREVIGRRLNRLSERCNQMLTMAAVIGRQFRFGVLKMLVEDTTEGQLLDAMDEALSARIIEELPSEVGLYQFTHASMQETLTGELSANRRVRMHARIGEALESYYGDRAEEHAAELVEHFAEAETVLGTEKLVKHCLAAGERALASYAYEAAEDHFSRAIRLHDSEDAIAIRLNVGLATALMNTSERSTMQRACDALTRALTSSEKLGSGELTAQRLLPKFPLLPVQGVYGMAALYKRALEGAKPGTIEYADLLIGVGHWAQFELYDQVLRDRASEQALEISRRHCDDLRTLRALLVRYVHRDTTPGIDREIEQLVGRVQDPIAIALGAEMVAYKHANSGDLHRAQSWHERGVRAGREGRNRWATAAATGDLIQNHLLAGRLDRAREMAREAIAEFGADSRLTFHAIKIEALLGDVPETRRLIALARGSFPSGSPVDALFGFWPGGRGSLLLGIDLIDREKLALAKANPSASSLILGVAGVLLKDEQEAALRYNQSSEEDLPRLGAAGRWVFVHGLALMAAFLGRHEEAYGRYEEVLERTAIWKSPVVRSLILVEFTEFLLDRDGPGDREKAIELQDEAIAIARELGMRPLLERVLAKRQILRA